MGEVFALRNVSYTYPTGQEALLDISMKVMEGEILGIVGPNGAGKSTLLMLLDALIPPTSGEIFFRGIRLNDKLRDRKFMYEFRKKVSLVFQDPDVQLFSSTVRKDIAFGPEHLGLNPAELERRIDETLKVFRIEHLAQRHPYNLSYGEKRKAAIATVYPIGSDVILLDEPTSNLDLRSRREVIGLMKEFEDEGKTVVVSSHDLDLILEVASRIYVLNRRIIAEGDPWSVLSDEELLERNDMEVPKLIEIKKLKEELMNLAHAIQR